MQLALHHESPASLRSSVSLGSLAGTAAAGPLRAVGKHPSPHTLQKHRTAAVPSPADTAGRSHAGWRRGGGGGEGLGGKGSGGERVLQAAFRGLKRGWRGGEGYGGPCVLLAVGLTWFDSGHGWCLRHKGAGAARVQRVVPCVCACVCARVFGGGGHITITL